MTVSAVPAAQAFSALQSLVSTYVGMPSHADVTTSAKNEINQAIRELNTRNWGWSLTSADITLVAGTRAYDLATTFKAGRNLSRLDGSNNPDGFLVYRDPKTFDLEYPQAIQSGEPEAYTVYNYWDSSSTRQVTLSLAPNAAFITRYPKLRMRHYRRQDVLTQDSDVLVVPSEAELFVVWCARYTLCLQYDPDGARCRAAYQRMRELWQSLIRDDEDSQAKDWD